MYNEIAKNYVRQLKTQELLEELKIAKQNGELYPKFSRKATKKALEETNEFNEELIEAIMNEFDRAYNTQNYKKIDNGNFYKEDFLDDYLL